MPRCVGSTSTYRRSTPVVAARCFGRSQRTLALSIAMAALAANIDLEDDHAPSEVRTSLATVAERLSRL